MKDKKVPLVSIVLPTYNGAKYIRESINSILQQSFDKWELIIVDDCSSDNTLEIVEQYAKMDSRIIVIHNNENKKLPQSLNIGFSYSSGEFLTWTSDDNYYLPKALETMYKYLIRNKNQYMVCANVKTINSKGEQTNNLYNSYDSQWIYFNNCVGACFMYKRDVIKEVGVYDTNLFLVEDYDYWLRILKQYGTIGYIEKVLYVYRIHENSLTNTKEEQIKKSLVHLRKKNFDWILNKLKTEKSYICGMYYDFLEIGDDIVDIEEKMLMLVPEIQFDNTKDEINKKIIIFGAGNYGEKAIKLLKEKAVFFADNDKKKWGIFKCGLQVKSPQEIVQLYPQYDILIAVRGKKIYEIIQYLLDNGIKKYYTYQKLVRSLVDK